jgi:NADH-quinone oxidoreductase subunit H
MFLFLIYTFFEIIVVIVPLLISVAYFTLAERKIMGSIQRRKGPNIIGIFGLFQPLSDGLKLFTKETILPTTSNINIFLLAPIITFVLSLLGWVVIPFGLNAVISDINIGVLYLLAISSLSVYGILIGGWSSNSKYPFLGGLRSSSQMISYEISIGFVIMCVIICAGSFNLTKIILAQNKIWFFIPLFPMFIVFIISSLAETNRHPFDLPEAEAELVSGYNVEYSAMGFALFFLGEYSNMLLMAVLITIFFLGGWLSPIIFLHFLPDYFIFSLKILFFIFIFVWARAALPRYRYDQLMGLGWKIFLPISLSWILFVSSFLISLNGLPQ